MSTRHAVRLSFVATPEVAEELLFAIGLLVKARGAQNVTLATENVVGHAFGEVIQGGKKGHHVERAKRAGADHKGGRRS